MLQFPKILIAQTIVLAIASGHIGAQTFTTTSATPTDLTGANGTCATPGVGVPNVFDIPVAGVGILTATNALFEINITLAENPPPVESKNLNLVTIRVMSPTGTCVGIYSGGLSTVAKNSHDITLISRTACILNPYANGSNVNGVAALSAGNYGKFNAQYSSTDANLTTTFLGENANGTWKLIFNETTGSEPWVMDASLSFGDPTVTDRTADGDACATPIVWNGNPICASTNGKASSAQHPGYNGNPPTTFSNGTCDWNAANNNDVWIQFTPSQTNVCFSMSGHNDDLQSIVVTDPNTDGDNNPCTGAAGGQYWQFVSCPRTGNAIYASTAGTTRNQNHCFTANVGQTYYLVVDGNGGVESPFYLSAIVNSVNPLPVELLYFDANKDGSNVRCNWTTATEINNDYFAVERSKNGTVFEQIGTVQGANNSNSILYYVFYDEHPYTGLSYYRLRQVDFDGTYSYSNIVAVYFGALEIINIWPNPAQDEVTIAIGVSQNTKATAEVFNSLGQKIYSSIVQLEKGKTEINIPTKQWAKGNFLFRITLPNKEHTQKVIVK